MKLSQLEERLIGYDFEVFAHDWTVTFIEYESKQRYIFHNNCEGVVEFIKSRNMVLCGYNNKHYDQYILKGVLSYYEPEQLKEINNYIIVENMQGWTYNFDNVVPVPPQLDMMDDIVPRRSLKMLEGFMGMKIVESSVPFDIDRKLTKEEIKEVIKYNVHDVKATLAVYDERRINYVGTKLAVCKKANVDPIKGVTATNAKLTAMAYKAIPQDFNDERDYVYHENIDLSYIPKEIISFYDQLHDPNVSDDEIYKMKLKDVDILGTPNTYAWGGLHGAKPKYHDVTEGEYIILNFDFESYYPHLRWKNGYASRACHVKGLDEALIKEKRAAKANGDKEGGGAVKLILNTEYGAQLEPFNKLYDPLMGRSICITGQLYLTELLFRLDEALDYFVSIQNNTDGIMFKIRKSDIEIVRGVVDKFVETVDIPMEEEVVQMVAQKDVNNYVALIDGKLKSKGGMTSSYDPTFSNRHLEIVDKALVDYFAKGTDPAETVNKCKDILAFQMINKVGNTYDRVIHESHDGKTQTDLQRTNRVYASKDKTLGKIKKVKTNGKALKDKKTKEIIGYTDSLTSIPDCPQHAIVDNENQLKLVDIDKSWYIRLAKSRIQQFKGEEKMSETTEVIEESKVVEKKPVIEETIDLRTMDIGKLTKAQLLQRCKDSEMELAVIEKNGGPQIVSGIFAKMFELGKFLNAYPWEFDGYNEQTRSEYIKSAQFKTALHKGCMKLGLFYDAKPFDHDFKTLQGSTGKTMYWSFIDAEPTFTDIVTGESHTFFVNVLASDTLDKALLKCNTMIAKAVVQTHFLVTDASDQEGDGDNTEKEAKKGAFITPKQQEKVTEKVIAGVQYATDTQCKTIKELITAYREATSKATYGKAVLTAIDGGKLKKAKATALIMELEEKVEDVKGE